MYCVPRTLPTERPVIPYVHILLYCFVAVSRSSKIITFYRSLGGDLRVVGGDIRVVGGDLRVVGGDLRVVSGARRRWSILRSALKFYLILCQN